MRGMSGAAGGGSHRYQVVSDKYQAIAALCGGALAANIAGIVLASRRARQRDASRAGYRLRSACLPPACPTGLDRAYPITAAPATHALPLRVPLIRSSPRNSLHSRIDITANATAVSCCAEHLSPTAALPSPHTCSSSHALTAAFASACYALRTPRSYLPPHLPA